LVCTKYWIDLIHNRCSITEYVRHDKSIPTVLHH
jgi:hypothetical protein